MYKYAATVTLLKYVTRNRKKKKDCHITGNSYHKTNRYILFNGD